MQGSRSRSRYTALLLCFCTLFGASVAHAQARLVVLDFDGPMNQRARSSVLEALSSSELYTMVPRQSAESAAVTASADLATAEGRVAVARSLELSAFVGGTVSKRGPTFEVTLIVYNGSTGNAVEAGSVRGPKGALPRLLRTQSVGKLSAALAASSPPPSKEPVAEVAPPVAEAPAPEPAPERKPALLAEDEPAGAREASDDAAEAEHAQKKADKPDALELRLGGRALLRTLRYRNATGLLPKHTIGAPVADLALRWYPGAHVEGGLAAVFGLEVYGSFMFPVTSDHDGVAHATKGSAFGIGAHARIPLGDHSLGVLAGYGLNALSLDEGEDGSDAGIPGVNYGFLRAGLDARIQLSEAFALAPRVAYRLLTSYGELGDDLWFSHVGGGGLEGELTLRYAIMPLLTIDLGGGLVRYFLSFHPEAADPGVVRFDRIADGAADQQLYGTLGVTLSL